MKADMFNNCDLIVWANIKKFQAIQDVSNEKLSACLGVKNLKNRDKSYLLTTKEIGRVCKLLKIEPYKLFEV